MASGKLNRRHAPQLRASTDDGRVVFWLCVNLSIVAAFFAGFLLGNTDWVNRVQDAFARLFGS